MSRCNELMGKLEALQPEDGVGALLLGFALDEAYVHGDISESEWRYMVTELTSPIEA